MIEASGFQVCRGIHQAANFHPIYDDEDGDCDDDDDDGGCDDSLITAIAAPMLIEIFSNRTKYFGIVSPESMYATCHVRHASGRMPLTRIHPAVPYNRRFPP